MAGWLVFVGYLVGALLGARCAAVFMARMDRNHGWEPGPWEGEDWLLVVITAVAWPIVVPIGHLMSGGHIWPFRSSQAGWVQRLLSRGL
jgi:hypothetical protein